MPDIRLTRKNPVLTERESELTRNLLALRGGRPYVEAALTRFVNEPETSWEGDKQHISGRRERAYNINYAGRIVAKMNQFLFGQQITRDGLDEEWAGNVTLAGDTLDDVMDEVSAVISAARWCWLQVDRGAPAADPQTGQPTLRTAAQREAAGDSVFWVVWDPTAVVDWSFDAGGRLQWLITEHSDYTADDPAAEPVTARVRTIWRGPDSVRIFIKENGDILREEPFSTRVIPFVPCGKISPKPHWFDDIEGLQAATLNLESVGNENLIKSVYAQLVLPLGMLESIQRLAKLEHSPAGFARAVEMARGLAYPILEPTEAAGLSRYITPGASDLAAIPTEIVRLVAAMYDVVGMMIRKETRQAESAEAKQLDRLDVEAVLKRRALLMQSIETKAVALSKTIDTAFKVWTPAYPTRFDVVDFAGDVKALMDISNLTTQPKLLAEKDRTLVDLMDSQFGITPENKAAILVAIDSTAEDESQTLSPTRSGVSDRGVLGPENRGNEDEVEE